MGGGGDKAQIQGHCSSPQDEGLGQSGEEEPGQAVSADPLGCPGARQGFAHSEICVRLHTACW